MPPVIMLTQSANGRGKTASTYSGQPQATAVGMLQSRMRAMLE